MPLVEVEVLPDGSHTIERCEEVTDAALHGSSPRFTISGSALQGMLLMPNMVVSGTTCPSPASTP